MWCSPAFVADIVLDDGDDVEEENNVIQRRCIAEGGLMMKNNIAYIPVGDSLPHTRSQNNLMLHKHMYPVQSCVHRWKAIPTASHSWQCKSQKLDRVGVGARHIEEETLETSSPPSCTHKLSAVLMKWSVSSLACSVGGRIKMSRHEMRILAVMD